MQVGHSKTQQNQIVGVWLLKSNPFRGSFIRKSDPGGKKKHLMSWTGSFKEEQSLLTTASLHNDKGDDILIIKLVTC